MSRDQRRRGRAHPGSNHEPGCSGKVRYRAVDEAVRYGLVSRGVLEGGAVLRAYECATCGAWHLTKITDVPWFELSEVTVPDGAKPNMLTVSFTLPKAFKDGELAEAVTLAMRAAASVFGDAADLRSHVSFPHHGSAGVDLALVSIHPVPPAVEPTLDEEPTL